MNDNRYSRQTYKNLLGGGGGVLSDNENIMFKSQSQLGLNKLQPQIPTSQSYSNQLNTLSQASIRNALGDIGNRIGLPVQQQQQGKFVKPVELKPEPVANNSCIMLEEDEHDEEVEEIELDEDSMHENIIDIDECDTENTQLVAEYVKDIYKYLNQMEKKFRIRPNFLESKIVTTKMRSVLIDWLIQVHLKFHLLQETLYLCVQIIDAYLQVQDVPKMQLQLVGVTAMFLASKYEEMYVPAIDDFVYMTDNTYTKSEIRQMEISILKTLNFMFGKPLPLHFLRRFSKAGQADPKQHTLAKYFMELSLHDAEFSAMDPSYLAACSLCLSFKLLNGPEWNKTLEFYSTYKLGDLLPGMQKLAKLTLKSLDADYKYRAATNKYGASKFMRISLIPELSSQFMRELACGNWMTIFK